MSISSEAEVSRSSIVTLREISADDLAAVLALDVAAGQRAFVASNAKSIAEAHYHPEAWLRAIYADATPVGLLMLHDEALRSEPRQRGFYFLWRLMIDARFQRLGFGRRAVELLVAHVRARPDARRLLTSFRRGEGSPAGFYRRLGFAPTGREEGGEVELALEL